MDPIMGLLICFDKWTYNDKQAAEIGPNLDAIFSIWPSYVK